MKNSINILCFSFLLMILPITGFSQGGANWIWQSLDGPANTWVAFRKTITLNTVPTEAITNIAVDSKYWLWINGEMVLFEGGLTRGAAPNTVYYDPVDFAPYLKQGENTIAILVWYWGRTRKSHEDSGRGGLCVEAPWDQRLNTNSSWKMKVHEAYDPNSGGGGFSNSRVTAYNVKFDARKAMGDWTSLAWYGEGYNDNNWNRPIQKGGVNSQPWGTWVERSIPQWNDRGLVDYESLKVNNAAIQLPYNNNTGSDVIISAKLPFNKQVTPFIELNSTAGRTIVIDTDNSFNLISSTYITTSGTQEFEGFSWFNGHNVEYTIPSGVQVIELQYRWTGVGEMTGYFQSSDEFYNRLWWMARNTLYICARDGYMDCPDRERALWLGDVADQTGAVFYTLDEPGRLLLKKAIDNTIAYRDGDIIRGLAPGFGNFKETNGEFVGQSLQFIDQAIWQYYYNTGDIETLTNAYPAVFDYLKLWSMMPDGLPELRRGDVSWIDWGSDSDFEATLAVWYYIALKGARKMAVTLEQTADIAWYDDRIQSIEANFDRKYWRGTHYNTQGREIEERVSSLAVISGLANEDYIDILVEEVLFPIRKSSPHMEWLAEEALIIAGHPDKALSRMKDRYAFQVNDNELTTLYERFENQGDNLGTPNHAWNAPNYILSRYVTGVRATSLAWSTYEVLPDLVNMASVESKTPSVKGDIFVEIQSSLSNFNLRLVSPSTTMATVGIPKTYTTINEVTANGQTIWRNGSFLAGVTGLTFVGEDEAFLKFEVSPGTWVFDAAVYRDAPPAISIVSPEADAFLKKDYEKLEINVDATDDRGIAKVEVYLSDQLILSKTESPFQWNETTNPELLDWPAGKHVLKAITFDTNGQTKETSIEVTVSEFASKLSGSVFGTPDIFCRAGKNVDALFDGDLSTFMDTNGAVRSEAWAGIDFGEGVSRTIAGVGYAPRIPADPSQANLMRNRLAGTKIYGTNQVNWDQTGQSNDVTADTTGNLLYEITMDNLNNRDFGELSTGEILMNTDKAYRYVLWFFPNLSFGNSAELEVYTNEIIEELALSTNPPKQGLSMYLANDALVINSGKNELATITIYSLTGRLILDKHTYLNSGVNSIQLSQVITDNMVYIINVETTSQMLTQKVVRVK